MKLSTQDTANLSNIISTCLLGGIESVIIENETVRGVNEARTFVIISNSNVPKFPQKIGLSRLGSLKQRLELFAGNSATVIEAKESDRGEISSLDISAGRNKAQFRCTSTALIKAPKSVNDTPLYKVFITAEELKLVLNAIKVMGGKNVALVIKKDKTVQINLTDSTNDVFTSELENKAHTAAEGLDSVVHYYHADIFHPIMRARTDEIVAIEIGEAGTITTGVNGHTVVLMPKINEDSED